MSVWCGGIWSRIFFLISSGWRNLRLSILHWTNSQLRLYRTFQRGEQRQNNKVKIVFWYAVLLYIKILFNILWIAKMFHTSYTVKNSTILNGYIMYYKIRIFFMLTCPASFTVPLYLKITLHHWNNYLIFIIYLTTNKWGNPLHDMTVFLLYPYEEQLFSTKLQHEHSCWGSFVRDCNFMA